MAVKKGLKKGQVSFLVVLVVLSALGMVIVLLRSYEIHTEISALNIQNIQPREFLNLLGSIKDLMLVSSLLIFLLAISLAFSFYYFLTKQNKLIRAASIIRKSQNRYRFFTEAPPTIGILRFDLIEGKVQDVNRAAINLFAKTRADMVGKSILKLVPEKERQKLQEVLDGLRSGEINAQVTVRVEDDLGIEKYVSFHITSLKNPDAEPEAICVVLDVTDKKKAEEERLEKERLAGVLEMAGATAHELNQPLQVISGTAWMMLQRLPEDDPSYKKIKKICDEVERMTNIAQKISSISSYKVKRYVGETTIIDIEKAAGTNPSKANSKFKRIQNS